MESLFSQHYSPIALQYVGLFAYQIWNNMLLQTEVFTTQSHKSAKSQDNPSAEKEPFQNTRATTGTPYATRLKTTHITNYPEYEHSPSVRESRYP